MPDGDIQSCDFAPIRCDLVADLAQQLKDLTQLRHCPSNIQIWEAEAGLGPALHMFTLSHQRLHTFKPRVQLQRLQLGPH